MIKGAEFKEGDEVTFKPYEKACKCRVVSIQVGMWGNGKYMSGEVDTRIFYKLSGEATTSTSGKSIMESALFERAIMDFDVPYYLLTRIPTDRREANKENYHWLMRTFTMTGDEMRKLTDAYDDRAFRYKVRES